MWQDRITGLTVQVRVQRIERNFKPRASTVVQFRVLTIIHGLDDNCVNFLTSSVKVRSDIPINSFQFTIWLGANPMKHFGLTFNSKLVSTNQICHVTIFGFSYWFIPV